MVEVHYNYVRLYDERAEAGFWGGVAYIDSEETAYIRKLRNEWYGIVEYRRKHPSEMYYDEDKNYGSASDFADYYSYICNTYGSAKEYFEY